MKNKIGADVKATNWKFNFKGNFSGNIGENGLFSGQNKLVLTKSRLFFLPDSLNKFLGANVKNGTDIRATNQTLGRWGMTRWAAGTKKAQIHRKLAWNRVEI